jgi:molybdopterin molybdotransferase
VYIVSKKCLYHLPLYNFRVALNFIIAIIVKIRLKSTYMTIEITQALSLIEENIQALSVEIIPLEELTGRIISEDIHARYDLPAFDNSAMDGYAVCCSAAGKDLAVEHTIFAGDVLGSEITECTPYKIMTGAPIPKGCEAIVPIENVSVDGLKVSFPEDIKKATHIRRKGEDISTGDLLLEKGSKVHGLQIALLASQGISHVHVYKRPKVAVFASGEELKMHFESVKEHQIYNSNAPTFLARAKELGAEVSFIGSAKDNLEDLKAHIEASLDADLIVTSGGVSVGDADFTREAFEAFGLDRLFDKINIKPGKPTSLGKIGNSWVLNLPGNPFAALVNFELFGVKTLHKLSGNRSSHLGVIRSEAKEDISLHPGRVTVLPGTWDGLSFLVTHKRSPGMLSPLIHSNALAIASSDVSLIKKGEEVLILPIHAVHSSDTFIDFING